MEARQFILRIICQTTVYIGLLQFGYWGTSGCFVIQWPLFIIILHNNTVKIHFDLPSQRHLIKSSMIKWQGHLLARRTINTMIARMKNQAIDSMIDVRLLSSSVSFLIEFSNCKKCITKDYG